MPERMTLKAPFPWAGGKSRIAPVIWSALGQVDNYVEPLCGSAAVLLARPDNPTIETINDLDGFVVPGLIGEFFWRREGGRTATAGRYSYAGVRLFLSWGYRDQAHCAWTSYFIDGGWTSPHPGCPIVRHDGGNLSVGGHFRLPCPARSPDHAHRMA